MMLKSGFIPFNPERYDTAVGAAAGDLSTTRLITGQPLYDERRRPRRNAPAGGLQYLITRVKGK